MSKGKDQRSVRYVAARKALLAKPSPLKLISQKGQEWREAAEATQIAFAREQELWKELQALQATISEDMDAYKAGPLKKLEKAVSNFYDQCDYIGILSEDI